MIKVVALLLVVAVGVFLVYVALKPAEFRITRSQSIHASPEKIFALINDLHAFNRWNSFSAGDAGLKLDYSGPQTGQGAAYTWDSTGKTGKGRMTIIDSSAPSRVAMRLEFIKPMTATNTAEFALVSAGASTTVTWSMRGTNTFLYKLMGTIFNMDKMVGGEFEKGLANLEAIADSKCSTSLAFSA